MTPFKTKKIKSFSSADAAELKKRGISIAKAEEQLRRFKRGFPFVELVKPCTVQEGIWKLSQAEEKNAENLFSRVAPSKQIVKFVPASGAASRMFHFLQESKPEVEDLKKSFLKNLPQFAFYEELKRAMRKRGLDLEKLRRQKKLAAIVQALLENQGLGYQRAPKGLILFHGRRKTARTAFQEQLAEAVLFQDKKRRVRAHFTLPVETRGDAVRHLQKARRLFSKYRFNITDSVQSPATDCLAVDERGFPARGETGKLLLRPAGHGALLENLNQIKADVVYIKNIDNILPEAKRREADRWKKILTGVFLEIQADVFWAQAVIRQKKISPEQALRLLKTAAKLGWQGKGREALRVFFDRPLRVGGVVPNTGEPGGGPFWIRSKNGLSAQIVESAEVNFRSTAQDRIWRSSTHFNPVEFVCGVCDYRGKKYNLMNYVDRERSIITRKSDRGRAIRAMELPGLWNGGMGDWLTVFVEIPAAVFAPVKTVLDLLRKEHQVKS